MQMQMTQEALLCGYELISPYKGKGKSEIRKSGLPLQVVFTGTYRQCKKWAKDRVLLRTQAPSAK